MPQLLNRRRELFALEVASGAPLGQAYVAAGFKAGERYDCRHNASKLYNKPEVKERVRELQAQYSERAAIGADYVRERIAAVVDVDPLEAYEVVNGALRIRPLDKIPARVRRAIARIEMDSMGFPTRVIFADRVAAGTALLRSLGEIKDSDVRVMTVLGKAVADWSDADVKLIEERLAKGQIAHQPAPVEVLR